jgi:hypothetical protein
VLLWVSIETISISSLKKCWMKKCKNAKHFKKNKISFNILQLEGVGDKHRVVSLLSRNESLISSSLFTIPNFFEKKIVVIKTYGLDMDFFCQPMMCFGIV